MIAKKLRKAVLKAAMEGKLTYQLDNDENAIKLIAQIKKQKENLVKLKKIRPDKETKSLENIKVEKIIPKNWVLTRLGEIANYKKGPFGSSLTKSMFVPKSDSTIKVYEQKNAIQKSSEIGDYYIKKQYYEDKMTGFIVEPGDIIISCAGTIGEIYQLPLNAESGIINQALMRVRLFDGIDSRFFSYLFTSMLNEIHASSSGSAIKNIPPFSILKNILILLPPYEEQKRIVEKLEVLLAEIDKLEQDEKALKELEDKFPVRLKKSLLKSAIGGNFSKINLEYENKVDKLKYQNNESLNEVESLLGKINYNWIVTNLKQIADISTGRKDANHAKQNGIYRFYTCAKEYFMSDTFSFEGESLILPGNGANVGQVYRYSGKFEAYQRTYIIQVKSNFYQYIDMNYLEYLFHAYWGEYNKDKMFGSATPYIKLGNLVNFPVVIPPIDEQKRIVEKLDKLFAVDLLNI